MIRQNNSFNPAALRVAMARRKITACQLAEKINKKTSKVTKYLLGLNDPSYEEMRKIAIALEWPMGFFYNKNVEWPIPFEISVDDIEIFPSDEELPDFDDLRGRAPDILEGKTSEEYIAELRDDWY